MDPKDPIGLVLAGGGARGAYEIGALSVLLPEVARREADDPESWRPDVIVGTSVGAINASYLAATADEDLTTSLNRGLEIWQKMMSWERVLSPVLSFGALKTLFAGIGDAFDIPGVHARSLVDSSPLERSLTGKLPGLPDGIPFEQIEQNVESGRITAAAVVATVSTTSLSRVFYSSQDTSPPEDRERGIDYVRTRLNVDHVLASAAIPGLFRARHVSEPSTAAGWYVDGGTRLNTPISPALKLGAKRLIIVALNCPVLGRPEKTAEDHEPEDREPEALDGAEQLLQAVLIDPLVNDLHTLTRINTLVSQLSRDPDREPQASARYGRVVPYILVAPEYPHVIGQIAVEVLKERYGKLNSLKGWGTLGILGDILDVPKDKVRGELFSYLFFDEEFGRRLIEQGREDARRCLRQAEAEHERVLWRTSEPPES